MKEETVNGSIIYYLVGFIILSAAGLFLYSHFEQKKKKQQQ